MVADVRGEDDDTARPKAEGWHAVNWHNWQQLWAACPGAARPRGHGLGDQLVNTDKIVREFTVDFPRRMSAVGMYSDTVIIICYHVYVF